MSSRSPPPPTPEHWADNEKVIPRGPPPQYIPDMDPEFSLRHKKKKRPLTERNCCCRWLCCAYCLPVWARYIVWFIIIGIIICIIVIGALLGSFKMPTVNLDGVTASPEGNSSQITYDGKTFSINIGLIVNIQNPNVLPLYLSDIQAVANFPLNDGTKARLGQGTMDYQYVPTQSDFNFTFPFTISYDPSSRSSTTMLNSLMEKCGLTGGEAQDISVDYTINLAARVLFVTVHPTISSSASFACPLTNGGIPGLSSGALSIATSSGDDS